MTARATMSCMDCGSPMVTPETHPRCANCLWRARSQSDDHDALAAKLDEARTAQRIITQRHDARTAEVAALRDRVERLRELGKAFGRLRDVGVMGGTGAARLIASTQAEKAYLACLHAGDLYTPLDAPEPEERT